MPNLNYENIARVLSKSEPQIWRLTDNGGMVLVTADGRRLSFTPAEVSEAELIRPDPVILSPLLAKNLTPVKPSPKKPKAVKK
jgi:hypothetical protein